MSFDAVSLACVVLSGRKTHGPAVRILAMGQERIFVTTPAVGSFHRDKELTLAAH